LIYHISEAPKNKKLQRLDCALPFKGYQGSLVEGNIVKDYYDYPLDYQRFQVEIYFASQKYYCILCGKEITEKEYANFDSMCRECYELEIADADLEE
jgi:hypothetical protein